MLQIFPHSNMIILTVNYREKFFPKLDLTRILGIPTYDALHQIKLELDINALYVHSNLGGGTHGHLGIWMINTKYATLSPIAYVRPVHPSILQIPSNATRVASYKLRDFTTRISKFSLKYMGWNKHSFNKFSHPSMNNKLSPRIIVGPDNLRETYVRFSHTSYQRTKKSHQVI